jgi:hypothetical protein
VILKTLNQEQSPATSRPYRHPYQFLLPPPLPLGSRPPDRHRYYHQPPLPAVDVPGKSTLRPGLGHTFRQGGSDATPGGAAMPTVATSPLNGGRSSRIDGDVGIARLNFNAARIFEVDVVSR